MYHFISGYTAKIAGTEAGITEPQATFSACFGSPFLPLHPSVYARMLGEKMEDSLRAGGHQKINVWLVNTGWTGGGYGVGNRIELSYTRAMIKAALNGNLDKVEYHKHPNFKIEIPKSCPDVPNAVLNPRDTWRNEEEYDEEAAKLVKLFHSNFDKYEKESGPEISNAGPVLI